MPETLTWTREHFPVVYEHGEPKAVLVDMETFRRIELILDNLLNREPETEDRLLAQSPELKRLAERVRMVAEPSPNWKRELDEL